MLLAAFGIYGVDGLFSDGEHQEIGIRVARGAQQTMCSGEQEEWLMLTPWRRRRLALALALTH